MKVLTERNIHGALLVAGAVAAWLLRRERGDVLITAGCTVGHGGRTYDDPNCIGVTHDEVLIDRLDDEPIGGGIAWNPKGEEVSP